jgi:uncharacterized integral membrane protein
LIQEKIKNIKKYNFKGKTKKMINLKALMVGFAFLVLLALFIIQKLRERSKRKEMWKERRKKRKR